MIRRTLLPLTLVAIASAVRAGGPLVLDSNGDPVGWSVSAPVPYHVDQGGLGLLTNGEAVTLVDDLFQVWEQVTTATITYQNAGPLGLDVDATNFGPYLGPFGGAPSPLGQNAIVFDEDGAIFDALYGVGTGVLGFAAPTWMSDGITTTFFGATAAPRAKVIEGLAFLNGKFIDGIDAPGNGEILLATFEAVFVHEFGHFSGLDHTQIRGGAGPPESDSSFTWPVEVMYSFLSPFSQPVLQRDDEVSLSLLYPTADFFSTTWRLSGTVRTSQGQPVSGVNVIARNLVDPDDTVSQVTGAVGLVEGRYTLAGLGPGHSYTVEVQEIDAFAEGGSSVGPFETPLPMPGPPEFYNGAGESADPGVDDPSLFDAVSGVAGEHVGSVDVILNEQLFRVDNQVVTEEFYTADTGDFDGDGILDLIVTRLGFDPGNQILFLRGTGGGAFAPSVVVDAFPGNEHIVAGQFNPSVDQFLDFVVTSTTLNEVRLYLGDGDGGFGAPTVLVDEPNQGGTRVLDLVASELTGEGMLDLVTVIRQPDGSANVHTLVADGLGGFGLTTQNLAAGTYPSTLERGRISSQMRDDVVGLDTVNNILVVLASDGTGGLTPFVKNLDSFTTRTLPALATGDLNGDGFDDVVLSDAGPVGGPQNATRTWIDILLNFFGGFGYHGRYQIPESFQWEVEIVDLDHDGLLDIVSTGSSAGPGRPGAKATIGFGDGTGGTREVVTLWGMTEFPNYVLLVADFDNDSWEDLLINKSAALGVAASYPPSILFNQMGDAPVGTFPGPPGGQSLVLQSYPNPASPSTTLSFQLLHPTQVSVRVLDVRGRRVRTMFQGEHPAGRHTVVWNGRDDRGVPVAQGVYFLQVTADAEQASRKVVILR